MSSWWTLVPVQDVRAGEVVEWYTRNRITRQRPSISNPCLGRAGFRVEGNTMTASRRVEQSPGGVGFIRTDATKPTVPAGKRQAWLREWGELHAEFAEADKRFYEGNSPRNEPPRAESTTEALFPSGCPGCGGAVRPGDVIGLVQGDWLCDGCFQL